MRFPSLFSTCTSACIVLGFLATRTSAYFVITEPHRDTQWVNGATNRITWSKGVLDGINGFDVEMARMSVDGLMLVAKNVPAEGNALNLEIQDVPPGNDYFLIFMNSTHGVMYATSPRFTILAASSQSDQSALSPDSSAPTVTISGGPNPTLAFATTFPALISAAFRRWGSGPGDLSRIMGVLGAVIGCLLGALWTLFW